MAEIVQYALLLRCTVHSKNELTFLEDLTEFLISHNNTCSSNSIASLNQLAITTFSCNYFTNTVDYQHSLYAYTSVLVVYHVVHMYTNCFSP